jgi:hypothetical protein
MKHRKRRASRHCSHKKLRLVTDQAEKNITLAWAIFRGMYMDVLQYTFDLHLSTPTERSCA